MAIKKSKFLSVGVLALVFGYAGDIARAGEGGASHYVPGTRNDFLMGVFGPPGVYVRNDLFYFDMDIAARPLGGQVTGQTKQKVLADTVKLSYLSDFDILGGRYGASLVMTYVLDANVSGSAVVGGGTPFKKGARSGWSDMYLVPAMVNWKWGKNNFTLAPGIYAPTGGYGVDRTINTGRNYWSFDLAGNYTWFDPVSGWEASVGGGVMYNWENPETDYQTGTELHLDWTIAKHFPKMAVGLSGYWLQQLTADKGSLIGPLDPAKVKDYRLTPVASFGGM